MKCKICGGEVGVLTSKLRRGTGTVYYCSKCDYGMLNPNFTNASDYYNEEYRKKFKDILEEGEETPEQIYNMRCTYQQDRINIIEPFFDKKKTFLEIGCSAGQFLSSIKDKFKSVVGIELSQKCAEYVYNRWNIPVYTEELSSVKWDEEVRFDYIGFFQVLEHIENPEQFLRDVANRLKPNGRIFIEIPNLNDPLRKLWNIPAYEDFYYHEAHLSYFSEKSIRLMISKAGLDVEHIYFIQDYNLLNNLYWYFNNAPQKSCEFGLNVPYIEFKTDNEESKKAAEEVNILLGETNKKYFDILSKYKLTSNMFVVAKM